MIAHNFQIKIGEFGCAMDVSLEIVQRLTLLEHLIMSRRRLSKDLRVHVVNQKVTKVQWK